MLTVALIVECEHERASVPPLKGEQVHARGYLLVVSVRQSLQGLVVLLVCETIGLAPVELVSDSLSRAVWLFAFDASRSCLDTA
jgi:hypothetical protein